MGSGSSDLYSADYLINYDIILVTLNYRLHALGDYNIKRERELLSVRLELFLLIIFQDFWIWEQKVV